MKPSIGNPDMGNWYRMVKCYTESNWQSWIYSFNDADWVTQKSYIIQTRGKDLAGRVEVAGTGKSFSLIKINQHLRLLLLQMVQS